MQNILNFLFLSYSMNYRCNGVKYLLTFVYQTFFICWSNQVTNEWRHFWCQQWKCCTFLFLSTFMFDRSNGAKYHWLLINKLFWFTDQIKLPIHGIIYNASNQSGMKMKKCWILYFSNIHRFLSTFSTQLFSTNCSKFMYF